MVYQNNGTRTRLVACRGMFDAVGKVMFNFKLQGDYRKIILE